MKEEEYNAVLQARLEILITDFQRFREEQREVNKELVHLNSDEGKTQGKILTTLKWHTVIGSFMMGAIIILFLKVLGIQQ